MAIFTIIGGNGDTGRELVLQLLKMDKSIVGEVRAVIRNAHVASRKPALHIDLLRLAGNDNRLLIVASDCTDSAAMTDALKDANFVYFCASGSREGYYAVKAVDCSAVQIVAQAALANKVERVVLISSQLTDPKNRWNPTRIFLNSILISGLFHPKGLMDLKFEGECKLRNSGQPYTIVRPARLVNGPASSPSTVRAGRF